ncbi:uncharacterized protein LOC124405817 [Diprion similis]|uniref:uncharacterized protein LOC124405817 n=1 Tax=Diprion similis TaxID=362088 RepID=UPI001EF7B160|nr:uncharacterized protein LOC124405817 [Diprion similis]
MILPNACFCGERKYFSRNLQSFAIFEQVLVLVGFVLVLLQDRFTWPNSLTMELRFTIIGVVVFVIGSIMAFRNYEEVQDVSGGQNSMLDLHLGIILSVTAVVMVFDIFLGVKYFGDVMSRD